MNITQSEPHESLSDIEYYSFRCTRCGDTDRRLLSRQRVAAAEIAASMKAAMTSSLPKPQERIGRKEHHSLGRRGFSNLRDKSPTAQRHWNRPNESFKDRMVKILIRGS
jgi:hypothetical protein